MCIDETVAHIASFESDGDHSISIIIGQTGPDQLHVGIAYKDDKSFNAIHLAWHNTLEYEENIDGFLKNFFWIKSKFHPSRVPSISAVCRQVIRLKEKQNIPYGLYFKDGKFTPEGILNLGRNEIGLTCATFVLAIFNSCGYKLIDTDSWPPRQEDEKWHEKIIQALINSKNRYNISETHIENVKKEKSYCARYRPEEVAISSSFVSPPAPYNEIWEKGSVLKGIIIS